MEIRSVNSTNQNQGRNRREHRNQSTSCLPDKVAQFYYSLGVVCSSYPFTVLIVTLFLVGSCCYPLINVPIPGNSPQQIFNLSNTNHLNKPIACFIQQIVVRTTVHPWAANLELRDAFRAPLYEVFRILEIIQNYQHLKSGKNLGHVCYQIDEVKKNYESLFPQFSCLLLSPANLWQQDVYKFNQDSNLLSTIFKQENLQRGTVSTAEMLFGINLKQTGIKRYPIRNRQRIIQYAITLFFKQHDEEYLHGLREKLQDYYPLHNEYENRIRNNHSESVYIYYPDELNYAALIPLVVTFFVLLLYVYYSFRKIDLIRRKFAMAFAAILSICSSLSMSLGICFFFGLTLSYQSNDLFPYLVIIVGLENVLILTKSVVSVPEHLDSKIRLAQGLSKEGWSITKNFLIELTILTIGLLTFVPIIQEFCIFTIVGLICDFFLQLFFFSTLLSIDIKYQIDVSELNRKDKTFFFVQNAVTKNRAEIPYRNLVANKKQSPQRKKLPKRLRLVHIWARTRFCQRAFMIWMIIWISVIIFRHNSSHVIVPKRSQNQKIHWIPVNSSKLSFSPIHYVTEPPVFRIPIDNLNQTFKLKNRLKHPEFRNWHYLSLAHWPAIFQAYNLTMNGRYVVILPNIRLSHVIRPDQAIFMRNNDEKYFKKFRWDALAAALDPLDFIDRDIDDESSLKYLSQFDKPYYPSSPMEIFLVAVLCLISVLVLIYTLIVFYRCICSRNYAEWRASWNSEKHDETETHFIIEAVPTILSGHNQEIEFLLTNESVIVSTCLLGQIKIWDAHTGDLLNDIDRHRFFSSRPIDAGLKTKCSIKENTSESSLTSDEYSYRLQSEINFDFSNSNSNCNQQASADKTFDFSDCFETIDRNGVQKSTNRSMAEDCNEIQDEIDLNKIPAIWCIDLSEHFIVIGCSNGSIEIWDIQKGLLKYTYEDECQIGITSIRIMNNTRIVTAKLIGSLDFYQTELTEHANWICRKIKSIRAHRQPITCLQCEGNRVVTGSKDHTLRVFRLDTGNLLYTLHGHCGPICCLFIDRYSPMTCGSASQDGLLSVWDLLTGTCIFSVQAHDGNVTALAYSSSYVISFGVDDRLCVWERFQGHLLNTIFLNHCYTSSILILSHHLIMTAKYGSLIILDARSGEITRQITLGNRDNCVFVKQLHLLEDAIVCDYGMELRIIRFPLICNKTD